MVARNAPKSANEKASGRANAAVTGVHLLGAFATLRNGLRQWMRANIPSDSVLTVPRASLLMGLSLKGEPAGMSELGESLGMSPRNMTVLVDGLEREGLVRRIAHDQDRRITLVELTPAGKDIAARDIGPAQETAAAMFDDFTAAERKELFRLLLKVADSLRARGIDIATRG